MKSSNILTRKSILTRTRKYEELRLLPVNQAEVERDNENVKAVEQSVRESISKVEALLAGKIEKSSTTYGNVVVNTESGGTKKGKLSVDYEHTYGTFNDSSKKATISDGSLQVKLIEDSDSQSGNINFDIEVSRLAEGQDSEPIRKISVESADGWSKAHLSSTQYDQDLVPSSERIIVGELDEQMRTESKQATEIAQQLIAELQH